MKRLYDLHYATNLGRNNYVIETIKVHEVSECPCCHIATSPIFMDGCLINTDEGNEEQTMEAFIIFYCPNCNSLYIAKYYIPIETDFEISNIYPNEVYPYLSEDVSFSDNINNLSPMFVDLYNQSISAETDSSTRGLAGLGYRKSLEYLIKDYLIKLKKQDRDTIIQLELAKCVDKLDDDLKDIAKASAWIGNDETHYFRKNPDYDIEDLKDFINCLVTDIEREYVRQKAKKLINKK